MQNSDLSIITTQTIPVTSVFYHKTKETQTEEGKEKERGTDVDGSK